MKKAAPYESDHSQNNVDKSLCSAKKIVPLIIELLKPKSVIDIGCATGAWLSIFLDLGVERILGVDGDYVDVNNLRIPQSNFLHHDLTRPLKLEQKFDLVLSLEVAEHIPEENAEVFVNTLTNLSRSQSQLKTGK